MKETKYRRQIENMTDDDMDELIELALDSDLCWDKFAIDNPMLLDDQYPDGFNEWLEDDFIERLYQGDFDKEFKYFLTSLPILK